MKKIYIIAYSKENLGDDLFVDILVNRYPNAQFYTRAIQEQKYLYQKNKNLHFKDYTIENLIDSKLEEFDEVVYIGGSIFMEHAGGIERIQKLNQLSQKCRQQNKKIFFISSNFGPYQTKEYKREVENLIKNVTDICFRDKKSYEEFKHLSTVRYAPDVVLSYNMQIEKQKNTIGISIINFKYRKDLKPYEQAYYKALRNSIINYIKQGKKVTLFSFCKYEGDEETIKIILEHIPDKIKENIEIQKYDGNIDEFIKKYSKMEYNICSRFHAMILSANFQQKSAIISYSSKIYNVINDLKLCKNHMNLTNIKEINDIKIEKFETLKINKVIKKQAEEQFKEIDRMKKKYRDKN